MNETWWLKNNNIFVDHILIASGANWFLLIAYNKMQEERND